MSKIDEIYNLFVNEGYSELPAKEESEKSLSEYLEQHGMTEFDYEEYVNSLSSESMRQGFIYGFQYAIDLLTSGKAVTA